MDSRAHPVLVEFELFDDGFFCQGAKGVSRQEQCAIFPREVITQGLAEGCDMVCPTLDYQMGDLLIHRSPRISNDVEIWSIFW